MKKGFLTLAIPTSPFLEKIETHSAPSTVFSST
jgi:hypothetical protein